MAQKKGAYETCKAKVLTIQEAYDALVDAVEDYKALLTTLISLTALSVSNTWRTGFLFEMLLGGVLRSCCCKWPDSKGCEALEAEP